MFPLEALIVRANNDIGRVSTLDPFDQAQQDAVIRLVQSVRGNTRRRALPHPPSSWSAETVTHARDYEETIKVVQRTLCQTVTSVSVQDGMLCVFGHGSELTYLKMRARMRARMI